MKSKNMKIAMALALCAMCAGFAQTAAARNCTMADAAGKYGFTSSGTILVPIVGPFLAVGHGTWTESGTVSGAQVTNVAGTFYEETFEGTYTVNADCTGSAVINVYRGSTLARTSNLHIVWDSHMQEARVLVLRDGTAITIEARKMFGE